MKNQAMAYIAESKLAAPTKQMLAELETLRIRNAILEEDAQVKKEYTACRRIRRHVGQAAARIHHHQHRAGAAGQFARRTLVRMAMDARPKEGAA